MFRSATFKLTMWYLALVMAISLAFSIVLYHVTTSELAYGLHRETQRIYNQFPIFDNSPMLRPDADDSYSQHRILLRLITFNIIVLVGAGIASYWLARRTLKPIEEAHEQQKRFTADVSHELRTPLTALKMESEVTLLNTHADKEELRNTLKSNLEEVSKLETLINNLLRLTRLEADEVQNYFKPIQVAEIIKAAIAQVEKQATDRKIHIEQSIKQASVDGDESSLTQLIIILLDNAIKYSSSNSSVSISSEAKAKANSVKITIRDNGIGIAPKNLERVFDRFYRAENSRSKSDSSGFGLGLSIAKMIADLHNGDVILSSKVGAGTSATIILPLLETKNSIDKPK